MDNTTIANTPTSTLFREFHALAVATDRLPVYYVARIVYLFRGLAHGQEAADVDSSLYVMF